MPKISDLSISTIADISNDDSLLIVDHETSQTKQIKIKDLIAVVAKALELNVQKDAGADVPLELLTATSRTCGEQVSVKAMVSEITADNYIVSASERILNFTYNTYNLANRFIVVGEKPSFHAGGAEKVREVLYDTRDEISGSGNIDICKPAGFSEIKVYVRSSAKSSYTYKLTCTNTECLVSLDKQFNVSPTPTSTPLVTPTPSPTSRDSGYLSISSTPTPTATNTPAVTTTPTATPTLTVTPTVTTTPGIDPSVTPTLTPTTTPGIDPSVTPTLTPTITPTQSMGSMSATPTPTPTTSPAPA